MVGAWCLIGAYHDITMRKKKLISWSKVVVFDCVEDWLVEGLVWTGPSDLKGLKMNRIEPKAKFDSSPEEAEFKLTI